ncbi:hypothetical protein K438DRAFT_1875121 [Mycena galopus ATCC 62051]|nr:hypothetical protein K438DRAFT_1875121 [Mycena galopus ATCC 62051]
MRWSLNYLSVRLVSVSLSACLENYPTIRDHPLANLLTETNSYSSFFGASSIFQPSSRQRHPHRVTPHSDAGLRGREHV